MHEEDGEVRPAVVHAQLRTDLRPVRRRAAAIVTASVAADAAAAVRRHQEYQLVRGEEGQVPSPALRPDQLRDDLRTVRRPAGRTAAAAAAVCRHSANELVR